LVVLVLAVLVDVRMGAQNVDHVRTPKLTGKVERRLIALEWETQHLVRNLEGGPL
jgi:hypothetical protein